MCQLASPCHVKVRRLYLNSSAASGFGYIMVTIVEYMYVYIYINKFNGIWDIWSTLICGCVWTCWIHQFTAISIGNSTVFPWPNQRMHCKRIQLIPTNTAQSISRMLRFKDLRPIISKIHMYLHLHLHVFM